MKNLGLYDNDLSVPRKQDIEAVKDSIPTKISQLENDLEYITIVEASTVLNNYVTKNEFNQFSEATAKFILQSVQPTGLSTGDFWYKIKS